MRRRAYLALACGAVPGLAGCSADGGTNDPTATPDPTAAGDGATATPSAPTRTPTAETTPEPRLALGGSDGAPSDPVVTFEVGYGHETADALRIDDGPTRVAPDGFEWLCCQLYVTNESDVEAAIGPGLFQVEEDGGRLRDHHAFDGTSSPLADVVLQPGGQVLGWVVFQLSRETRSATLRIDPGFYDNGTAAATFSANDDLSVPFETRE